MEYVFGLFMLIGKSCNGNLFVGDLKWAIADIFLLLYLTHLFMY